jgi:hypothetical protein
VLSLRLAADGRHVLSGGTDGKLKLWQLASGRCVWTGEGHDGPIRTVDMSEDGRYAVSGSDDTTVRLWVLEWELDEREADWDDGASPWLEAFLAWHTPPPGLLEKRLGAFMRGRKKPSWTEDDFQALLRTLGRAGYGWLRPAGVRAKLEELKGR